MTALVATVIEERRVPREWLVEALAATSVSQSALARRLDVSFQTVNRWVNGHAPITRLTWFGCLFALRLPHDWTPQAETPPKPAPPKPQG
jgi:hypothetical protein